ncbi:nucleoside hydrolase [Xanthomonas graminis]|jgi:inosine-uridine nucleoside N-ribohydrolase|uniref:Purine nucleosidase n=2 Tax=Xanthomonas graminis TaxID=3390026 RepID=A0A0K2ZT38_9XANT|nr:nucleoside hydrolase [Xanthomonas translucens]EKU26256.1 purine nucleosidase [Xanthomonas translucens pv. graminis ART-Xtg29]OAX58950.1 nucleoside hydrolase [Xanthomonas translucens pv. graminis]UKE53699.1 nucleoside hydrolase [Xanthomonas translucens pv. graminis]UKE64988.1 nucleoside hydrolase [Xanthomonas translucens pv. phlei]UKE74221.1 nucleoside hydrolase [Xanthomonas translucens pv. phleipratensis]
MSSPASASAGSPVPRRRVILEDDIDGFTPAQLLLLQSPEVEVLGISVVSGNIWRDEALAHTRRLLEIAGRGEVPVLPGPVHPLLNSELATERWEALYGKLLWKGAWTRQWIEHDTVQSAPRYHAHDVVPDLALGNPSVVQAASEPAALFMIRKVREFPGEVSIVATGPLTNLALAQRLDPQFASLARELVYMGGSLNPRQRRDSVSARQFAREFVNAPRREFNIRWDPEAASIVMRSPWRKLVMVPVDPSTATELTPQLLARMSAADTPIGHALRRREPGFPLWDELATALWLQPQLATVSETLYIDANTEFGPGYGDILSWAPGYQPGLGEQAQQVVREVDVEAIERLLVERLTAPQPPALGVPLPG